MKWFYPNLILDLMCSVTGKFGTKKSSMALINSLYIFIHEIKLHWKESVLFILYLKGFLSIKRDLEVINTYT